LSHSISHIARIIKAEAFIAADAPIDHLLIDSRKLHSPADSLFFAISGERRDGHQFIDDLYKKGVRHFVVKENIDHQQYPGASFLKVNDVLQALQDLAAFHRSQFKIPVIGITGSNGKTVVKEWLFQLLQSDHRIVRSPKSYNSQIGVPLSVWQMNDRHTLAIFEAGISQPGEMEKLEAIIRPDIGVLTNIGEAHSEGFISMAQKEEEKRILFKDANEPPVLFVENIKQKKQSTIITARKENEKQTSTIEIPFTDDASIQNAVTCWRVMLMLGYDDATISERMKGLTAVNMRLELKKGINHCSIINDSYSADIHSLEIALNFLDQQSAGSKKTVILSDLLQTGLNDEELYAEVMDQLKKHGVGRIIGIGEHISKAWKQSVIELYNDTDEFIRSFFSSSFKDETILIKGARVFAFERIVQLLELKAHQTVLEINLAAIVHNLKQYQKVLKPSTKVMAMVKAFAYGSGGAEIAGILQFHKVDYLGVAYADEGVELRNAGISLPIMVMNPEENAFEKMIEFNLEPELFSFESFHSFNSFLKQQGIDEYPVHIEIETGMNRLGFSIDEMKQLGQAIRDSSCKVQSVFSHLAASEDPAEDEFTLIQFERFQTAANELEKELGHNVIKHIANSAAVTRHPKMHMDMVRLGIGLYGIDSAGKLKLQTVATLRSTIAQLKMLKPGESVSYNRKFKVKNETLIATIRIGYADGFPRRLGNGAGSVLVNGKIVPVVGTVCMDMFMIDVTTLPHVKEGDEVIIFGAKLPVDKMSAAANTIPYEIMTGISQRVKRVYFEE